MVIHRILWIEVDKVLWTSLLWPPADLGASPPGCRLVGVTVAVLNTYKKNFLKIYKPN